MTRTVFVDTSALYATLDADDDHAEVAGAGMTILLDGIDDGSLRALTHSSVVVEAAALVQRRLGMAATRVLLEQLVPVMTVVWVAADLHARAVAALLAAGRRGVSLVDWTSFVVMRDLAIDECFAFDDDFGEQGFRDFIR